MNRHPLQVSSFSAATARQGCIDSLARGLIARAARRAPSALAERLEEEWLAALAERGGSMARLRLALGCCWATGVIALEHAGIRLRAAPSPADATLPGALILDESSLQPRRTVVFLVVVCLHVLVIDELVARLAWADIPHHDTETTVDLTYELLCKPQPATGC